MLAGYITGRSVRLARARERKGEIYLYDKMTFTSADFSDFSSIFALYLRRTRAHPEELVLGVAGPVIKNEVHTTNLPWHIRAAELEGQYDLFRVRLLNDLVAAAHGLFFLKEDRFFTINAGVSERPGNIGLMAAGQGLGQAVITYDGTRYRPYASEGGHSGFTPSNQLEAELWEYVYGQQGYVEIEDVLSLPGLETIYRFIVERERRAVADWFKKSSSKPDAIIEMALSEQGEAATKALNLFIDCYATEVANLALKGMTLGGVHLVGEMAPRIITAMDQGRFMDRFVKKGKMESILAGIPVKVVLDPEVALLGAAAMVISHKR